MITRYYSNPQQVTISDKSYTSNGIVINIFNKIYASINYTIKMSDKIYESNNNSMRLSSRIYSSDAYYHVDFKLLYAWGRRETKITEPKIDVTLLNKKYGNDSDVLLPTQGV
jgi:hypothetical protein